MINLELRKQAFEALGWKMKQDGHWHHPDCTSTFNANPKYHGLPPFAGKCVGGKCVGDYGLPAIEHAPAVSEPMFLEWCAKNGYNFELGSDSRGSSLSSGDEPRERLFYCLLLDDVFNEIARFEGETLSEARARAIVAASQVEGK